VTRATVGNSTGSGPGASAEIKSAPCDTMTRKSATVSRKLADTLAYPPRLMELERAAAYVGFGRTKFQELIVAGAMPKSLDVEGSPRWDRFDLDSAVDDLKETKSKSAGEIDKIIEKLKRGAA
jgi:hypothetical protein